MKKVLRIVIISVLCIGLIVGYYFYLSHRDKKDVENSTEVSAVEEVLMKDLEKDYPPTPREVVKFYNRILTCYYNEEYDREQFESLADQARALMDEELLANNPREDYLARLEIEINGYKEKGQKLANTTVDDSSDIVTKKIKGKECAFVTASYFIREGSTPSKTFEEYVLRKDDDGKWKILGYQLAEGETSE